MNAFLIIRFPRPDVAIEYDLDPDAAIKQRERAFSEAASHGHLVAGAHISFPGIGPVGKADPGYRWLAVPYANEAHGQQQALCATK
ncbi:Methyl parathion hydrolase [Desulfovibrio sp. TomC]|nr:Methyl parathion hydrolase [Desulfovibrio sp. TomC]